MAKREKRGLLTQTRQTLHTHVPRAASARALRARDTAAVISTIAPARRRVRPAARGRQVRLRRRAVGRVVRHAAGGRLAERGVRSAGAHVRVRAGARVEVRLRRVHAAAAETGDVASSAGGVCAPAAAFLAEERETVLLLRVLLRVRQRRRVVARRAAAARRRGLGVEGGGVVRRRVAGQRRRVGAGARVEGADARGRRVLRGQLEVRQAVAGKERGLGWHGGRSVPLCGTSAVHVGERWELQLFGVAGAMRPGVAQRDRFKGKRGI